MSATVTSVQAREALAASIARGERAIVLTGGPRSGKTALCRSVVDAAGMAVSWIDGRDALTFHEILQQAAADLQAGANPPATADDLAEAASEQELTALIAQAVDTSSRRAAVIVVDDAHAVGRFVIAKMQALLDLSTPERRITVLLAGDPALEQTLDKPECLGLRQQITTRLRIGTTAAPAPEASAPKAVRQVWTLARIRPGRVALIVVGLSFAAVALWVARDIVRRSPAVRPPVVASSPAPPSPVPVAPSAPPREPAPAPSTVEGAAASPAPPVASTPPPAATFAAPPAGVPPALADAGRPSTPELDAKLEQLHQSMEGEAIDLARRGDVNALIALRSKTQAAYAQIGARRPDFLAALLGELDNYLNQARSVRRP